MPSPQTKPSGSRPALEADHISRSFGPVKALDDVSFSVRPGSVHALIGENGAGKSTLIKVLTGVYQPETGTVLLHGEPARFNRPADAQDAGISTVYQEVNLIPKLSIARNVYLGREPRTKLGLIGTRTMDRKAQEVLDGFGLHVDVTAEADVVIMDEPTSSLERREVETLFAIVRRLRDAGKALIFVSHRLDELWEVCDDLTVLRDGRVVHTGTMAELDRRRLISLMLGRDIEEVAHQGATSFERSDTAAETAPKLTVKGLNVTGRLHDVSLSVRPGEVLGLAGLLGAGRSETVKAIYGALATTSSEVEVDGQKVRRNSIHSAMDAGIAMLSEDRKAEGIIPDLTVRENIMIAVPKKVSRFGVISAAKSRKLVEEYIDRLHIKVSGPEQLASELSGGNQQKVLLARWLATDPKVLLLDEPTRGIDVGAKAEVQQLIDDLAARGYAVVLISSETEEIADGSDRAIVLRDGRIDGELAGEELTNQRLLQVLVGTDTAQPSTDQQKADQTGEATGQ
ncbi:sugar ABC transporter ATP-binding protein [Acidipropionibacterium acidipropionici]|uniref:sugar ABC transporter ATP-binding protein n=1 Tax=Acidipropionibacterium acidipropionici TaxID=1748 RepID=UPI0003FFA3A6|nr:sugar ABC transporter ATP-binding protein [Acidipropionibacterium acidipropionici]ALN14515.1 sugar ABC transporter ATP-binding protein [Acidipropionibacterium acidipropionici]APZ09726.1 sugar ABC transporter ATP-binding protein [Acidipropionibacterium acidipropionici]